MLPVHAASTHAPSWGFGVDDEEVQAAESAVIAEHRTSTRRRQPRDLTEPMLATDLEVLLAVGPLGYDRSELGTDRAMQRRGEMEAVRRRDIDVPTGVLRDEVRRREHAHVR